MKCPDCKGKGECIYYIYGTVDYEEKCKGNGVIDEQDSRTYQ